MRNWLFVLTQIRISLTINVWLEASFRKWGLMEYRSGPSVEQAKYFPNTYSTTFHKNMERTWPVPPSYVKDFSDRQLSSLVLLGKSRGRLVSLLIIDLLVLISIILLLIFMFDTSIDRKPPNASTRYILSAITLVLYFKLISLTTKTSLSKRCRSCRFLLKILDQNRLNVPLGIPNWL